MEYKITIPGNPIAKGRPRVGKYGTYTPKKTADFESYVEYCWAAEYGNLKPSDKPLEVGIVFYMLYLTQIHARLCPFWKRF